jgi:hypothetical protein
MHDAPLGELPLVAPFSSGADLCHDFEHLFTRWGCLHRACRIGEVTAAIGYTFVFAALALIAAMFVIGFLPQAAKEGRIQT